MYSKDEASDVSFKIMSHRIGMLITIYDAAISAISQVADQIRNGQDATLAKSQALVRIGLIESGLDLNQGPIPRKIKELCGFVEHSLLASNPEEIEVALKVLTNLRDGYVGISDQARALEDAGEIPKLPTKFVDTLA